MDRCQLVLRIAVILFMVALMCFVAYVGESRAQHHAATTAACFL